MLLSEMEITLGNSKDVVQQKIAFPTVVNLHTKKFDFKMLFIILQL
jgi:hypothetical protein